MKPIQVNAPVAAHAPVATKVVADKYPVKVIGGTWNGKPTVKLTNNESNYKYDAFSGGATKVKQLFATDADGDIAMAKLAMWALQNGAVTQDELVIWMEKLACQICELIEDKAVPA